jgi:GNAT superfamily N-acetyltransferase
LIVIRQYRAADASAVGRLIADTYRQFNLSFAAPEDQERMLGPFQHAASLHPAHQAAIAGAILAPLVLVAEEDATVVGVLRGSPGRLHSLFVHGERHRRGIGSQLMAHFEAVCRERGSHSITLAATLYAVPFYEAVGYRRSTGVRHMTSFAHGRLPYQPMKKRLASVAAPPDARERRER